MSIKPNTYLNAATAALDLSARGIYIQARPSSLLSEMMDCSVSLVSPKTTDAPSILANPKYQSSSLSLDSKERAQNVEYITADFSDQSQHSLKTAALADDLAPFITQHVSFARNTVMPLVLDLAGKMEKFLQVAKPLDPASTFEIKQGIVPALLNDESFMAEGLENYGGVSVTLMDQKFAMEIPQEEDFYSAIMQLGNDRLNGLVVEWLGTRDKEFVKKVFAANFANIYDAVLYDYRFDSGFKNPYQIVDIALAGYIMANNLFNNPQHAKGVSLTEYKTVIRNRIDYCGVALMKAMASIRRQVENNVLVTEVILSKKFVVVNKPVYQAWLQSGGCPEAILGMLASGEVLYAVSAIEEAKEKLIRHWQNFVMLSQADVKAEMHRRFRDFLIGEMTLSLNDLSDSEKEYAKGAGDFTKRIMENVETELQRFDHRLLDDVHHLALHLVAKARFYYTSAYNILNEMTQVAKSNPDIDPREAALLSVIDYLAEFFVTQIQVTK